MKNFKKEVCRFVGESMRFSVGQRKCHENLRTFFTRNYQDPFILQAIFGAIDVLHHPSDEYRGKRRGELEQFFIKTPPLRVWEIAQMINVTKDLREDHTIGLFIPNSYFYDLKAFFLNLLLISLLCSGKLSNIAKNIFVIENEELVLSIKIERHEESGSRIFLVDLSEKGSITHDEIKKFSRGLHIFPNELDQRAFGTIVQRATGKSPRK